MESVKQERKRGLDDKIGVMRFIVSFLPIDCDQTQQFARYCCLCFSEAAAVLKDRSLFSQKALQSFQLFPFVLTCWILYRNECNVFN